jgi:hypothetical protein
MALCWVHPSSCSVDSRYAHTVCNSSSHQTFPVPVSAESIIVRFNNIIKTQRREEYKIPEYIPVMRTAPCAPVVVITV